MSTDLVPIDYTSELDRAADPAEFVIASVDRAKHWLAEALQYGDIDRIVELKSQAEAMRVYAMAKQLGKDAELSAAEIVRRAERGLGLAVRAAQEQGTVRARGYGTGPRHDYIREGKPVQVASRDGGHVDATISPNEYFANKAERHGVYSVTDGVTNEEFDDALAEAKAEENLSRANVLRKVKKEEKKVTAPTRAQIAGAGAQRRALTGACTTLAGIALGLRQIEDIHPDITSKEAAEWVGGLSEARLALERVIKRLKERTNNGV